MSDFENFQNLNQKLSAMVPATAQSTLAGLLDVYNTIVSKLVTVADSYARSYVTVQRLGTDSNGNVVDNTTANGQHIANQQIVRYQCDVKSLQERKSQLEELLRDTLQFVIPSTTDMSVINLKSLNRSSDSLIFNTFVDSDNHEITEVTFNPQGGFGPVPFYQAAQSTGLGRTCPNEVYTVYKTTRSQDSFISLISWSNTAGGWTKNDSLIYHMVVCRDEDGKIYYYNFTNTKNWWPKTSALCPSLKFNYIDGILDHNSVILDGTAVTLVEFNSTQYASIENDFPAPYADNDADLCPLYCAMVAMGITFADMDYYGYSACMMVSDLGVQTGEMHGNVKASSIMKQFAHSLSDIRDIETGDIVDVFQILQPGLKPTGLEAAMDALLQIDAT